jgi:tape measure domain-containing protein
MAVIKELQYVISLVDKVTSQLEKINSAFKQIPTDKNIAINAKTDVAHANVSAYNSALATIPKEKSTIINVVTGVAEGAIARLKGLFSGLASFASSMFTGLAMGAGFAMFSQLEGLIGEGVGKAQQYSAAQRILAATLNVSSDEAAKLIVNLKGIRENSAIDTATILQSAEDMATLGMNTQQVTDTTKNLSAIITKYGGTSTDYANSAYVLGRAWQTQTISGVQMNTLLRSGIPIYQILQKEMGLTTDQVAKLKTEISKGNVDFTVAFGAIEKGMKDFSAGSEAGAMTVTASISRIKDHLTDMISKMAAPGLQFLATTVLPAISRGVDQVTPYMQKLQDWLGKVAGALLTLLAPAATKVENALGTLAGYLANTIAPALERMGTTIMSIVTPRVTELWGKLTTLADQIRPVLTGALQELMPLLTSMGNLLQGIANAWNNLSGNQQTALIGIVATTGTIAEAAVAFNDFKIAVLGSATVQGIWATATAAYGFAAGVATGEITLMAGAQAVLNAVMSINPIYLVAAAIAALVAILVYAYINFKPFHDMVNATGTAIMNTLIPALTVVTTLFGGLVNAFGKLLSGDVGGFLDSVGNALNNFADAILNWVNNISNIDVVSIVEGFVDGIINAITGEGGGGAGGKSDKVATGFEKIFVLALPKILMAIGKLFEVIVLDLPLAILAGIAKSIAKHIEDYDWGKLGHDILVKITEPFTGAGKGIGDLGGSLKSAAEDFVTSIGQVPHKLDVAAHAFAYALGFALGKIVKWFEDLPENAKKFGDTLKTGIQNAYTAAVKWFTQDLPTALKKAVDQFGTWLFVSVPAAVIKFAGDVKDKISGFGGWLRDSAVNLGTDIANYIKTAVASFSDWLLVSVPTFIANFALDIETSLLNFGSWIMSGITATGGAIKTWAEDIANTIAQGFLHGAASHAGSLVTSAGIMPRMHGGGDLGAQEFPAILTAGERVLSPAQNKAFTNLVSEMRGTQVVSGIKLHTGADVSDLYGDPALKGRYDLLQSTEAGLYGAGPKTKGAWYDKTTGMWEYGTVEEELKFVKLLAAVTGQTKDQERAWEEETIKIFKTHTDLLKKIATPATVTPSKAASTTAATGSTCSTCGGNGVSSGSTCSTCSGSGTSVSGTGAATTGTCASGTCPLAASTSTTTTSTSPTTLTQASASANGKSVTIYTQPGCQPCQDAIAKYTALGYAVTTVDVGGWSASQLAAAGITGTPKIVEGTLTIDTVPSVTTKTAPTATIGAKLGAAGVLAKGVAPKVSTGDGNIISSLTASDQTMIDEYLAEHPNTSVCHDGICSGVGSAKVDFDRVKTWYTTKHGTSGVPTIPSSGMSAVGQSIMTPKEKGNELSALLPAFIGSGAVAILAGNLLASSLSLTHGAVSGGLGPQMAFSGAQPTVPTLAESLAQQPWEDWSGMTIQPAAEAFPPLAEEAVGNQLLDLAGGSVLFPADFGKLAGRKLDLKPGLSSGPANAPLYDWTKSALGADNPITQIVGFMTNSGKEVQKITPEQIKINKTADQQSILTEAYGNTLKKLYGDLANAQNTAQQNLSIMNNIDYLQIQYNDAQARINEGWTASAAALQANMDILTPNIPAVAGPPREGWTTVYDPDFGQYVNVPTPAATAPATAAPAIASVAATGASARGSIGATGMSARGSAHFGGIAGIPRFHSGFGFGSYFNNDEILAVLQKGERIFSTEDTAALEKSVKTTSAGIANREALRAQPSPTFVVQHSIHIAGNADERTVKKIKDYLESPIYQKTIAEKAFNEFKKKWEGDMQHHKVR